MAKVQNADGLSGSQAIILNVLAKASGGMSAHEIAHAGRVPVNAQTIGPISDDSLSNYPDSLRGREMVRAEQYEGDEVRWFLTGKGRRIGTVVKGRAIGPTNKVPPDILDPVVMAFKKTRAYGLEQYTAEDVAAVRAKLPGEYAEVDGSRMGDLHNQILARRKQGAYADPEEKKIKAMQKILREFGPTGTVLRDFLGEEQVQELLSRVGDTSGEE